MGLEATKVALREQDDKGKEDTKAAVVPSQGVRQKSTTQKYTGIMSRVNICNSK